MERHSSEALTIKDAIVRGDLDGAKRAATRLVESEWTSNLRKDWRPEMQAMRDAALGVANATDGAHAAHAFARMGTACASCHLAAGGPRISVEEPPPGDQDPKSVGMMRHAWATDQMWQGIMAPSSEAWLVGARALAEGELMGHPEAGTIAPEVTLLSSRTHELGRVAQAVDVDRTAAVLGEVLSTCARCHQLLNIKVR